ALGQVLERRDGGGGAAEHRNGGNGCPGAAMIGGPGRAIHLATGLALVARAAVVVLRLGALLFRDARGLDTVAAGGRASLPGRLSAAARPVALRFQVARVRRVRLVVGRTALIRCDAILIGSLAAHLVPPSLR